MPYFLRAFWRNIQLIKLPLFDGLSRKTGNEKDRWSINSVELHFICPQKHKKVSLTSNCPYERIKCSHRNVLRQTCQYMFTSHSPRSVTLDQENPPAVTVGGTAGTETSSYDEDEKKQDSNINFQGQTTYSEHTNDQRRWPLTIHLRELIPPNFKPYTAIIANRLYYYTLFML